MIILDATTKSLEVKLGGAITTTQLPFVVHYVEITTADQSVSAESESDGTTNSTTAVTMVAAPAAGKVRVIKSISIPNVDTVAAAVIIQYNNNGTTRRIWKGTLAVDDNLCYEGA